MVEYAVELEQCGTDLQAGLGGDVHQHEEQRDDCRDADDTGAA